MSDYWQAQRHADAAFKDCHAAGHEIPTGWASCSCGIRGTGPIVSTGQVMQPLTPEQAALVAEILTDHAGFTGHRGDFTWHQTQAVCPEYRIQGSLGFGGKLYRQGGRMWVDCYTEDATPERMAVIRKVNGLLAGIGGS